jgi:hypothetical protein
MKSSATFTRILNYSNDMFLPAWAIIAIIIFDSVFMGAYVWNLTVQSQELYAEGWYSGRI